MTWFEQMLTTDADGWREASLRVDNAFKNISILLNVFLKGERELTKEEKNYLKIAMPGVLNQTDLRGL